MTKLGKSSSVPSAKGGARQPGNKVHGTLTNGKKGPSPSVGE